MSFLTPTTHFGNMYLEIVKHVDGNNFYENIFLIHLQDLWKNFVCNFFSKKLNSFKKKNIIFGHKYIYPGLHTYHDNPLFLICLWSVTLNYKKYKLKCRVRLYTLCIKCSGIVVYL